MQQTPPKRLQLIIRQYCVIWGARGGSFGWGTALQGSIPDGSIGIFHWHNPSGLTMALGLTQPQTELSTRNISWRVKTAGAYGWQHYPLHVPTVLKSRSLNLLEPSGPIIYNKPTRCNSVSIVFINNYRYALHVSDALCVHHQEHYKL